MLRFFHRRERGQVFMFVALLSPILLGMAGMAVDVGSYAGHRRQLQNAADSIALAAAQQLCETTCDETSAATTAANLWAAKNKIDTSDLTLTFSGGSTAPMVRAAIHTTHKFAFMPVVGINSNGIGASAASVKVSFGGNNGIVPWSVTQATIDASAIGASVTMKYDATGANIGNFGAIRIDGPGANVYQDSVTYGSQDFACASGTPNCTTGACPGAYPSACAETSPTCDGPQCDPQTGNLIGPTRTAVDFRMNNTSAACDTFDEAFPSAGGSYHLNPDCNPWTDGPGRCRGTAAGDLCSRRVMVIPIVDGFGNGGSTPATILRFGLMYLEGYDAGKCQGNACEIHGRFVQAEVNTSALAGAFDPKALIQFAKLVE